LVTTPPFVDMSGISSRFGIVDRLKDVLLNAKSFA